ncbi:uncharacterized protein LOC135843863 [Planococcus citri]|uniref:uncharacterized protein LOC135843863 n=1 Tax=Planococcus citri TaxID=170843 RepID=UPI0031F95AD2
MVDEEAMDEDNEPKRLRNFKLENEDHTLGTLLAYILDKMPETEFCAYTIRHPTENVLYVRLKVKPGYNVTEVFKKGISELKKALDVVEKKFTQAFDSYTETKS